MLIKIIDGFFIRSDEIGSVSFTEEIAETGFGLPKSAYRIIITTREGHEYSLAGPESLKDAVEIVEDIANQANAACQPQPPSHCEF